MQRLCHNWESLDYRWTLNRSDGQTDLGGVEVNIYPNPARDFVNITFSKTYNYKVNLYTTSGRLLIKEDRAAVIEIGELASGIYILEVFIPETNQKAIEKLVVWK